MSLSLAMYFCVPRRVSPGECPLKIAMSSWYPNWRNPKRESGNGVCEIAMNIDVCEWAPGLAQKVDVSGLLGKVEVVAERVGEVAVVQL